MTTFLQPVKLPERCFLQEVLMWVAFQRLPITQYTLDGEEFRESADDAGYAIGFVDDFLSDEEARRAGIPNDPRWPLHRDEKVILPVAFFDDFLARYDLDMEQREQLFRQRKDAQEYQRDVEAWRPHYERAIEYPASQIFVALRSGTLKAQGRALSGANPELALDTLAASGRDIFDVAVTEIPSAFWSLQGLDFAASAARNGSDHYCHISCSLEDVITQFPGQREEILGVERIGDSFVLSEKTHVPQSRSPRGRPAYPWEAFHLEITDLIRRDELPKKKEAAIEHFKIWFLKEHAVAASRSVIGEKLKPYYDRFIKVGGQKTG